jgi:hypothetical protein
MTIATEDGKVAQEPPIDLLNDDPELHEPEVVDFSTYGKVIPSSLERPPPATLTNPASGRRRTIRRVSSTTGNLKHGTTSTSTLGAMPSSTVAPTRQSARLWTRCQPALIYQRSTRPLPSSQRDIAPTQRRRRPPVLDWASSASPRADKRARIRTEFSPNSPTSVSAARALLRSPAHWTSYAERSSTERSKLACMTPAKHVLEQRSQKQRQTSHPDMTPRSRRRPPTSARPQQQQRRLPGQAHRRDQGTHGEVMV